MAHPSPLNDLHRQGEGLLAPYGPPDRAVSLVEAFDPVEIEYAAIRRHAAVFDAPHRATLIVTGADGLAFLNRMLTQELKDLAPGGARNAFLLNRKGRIDADLRIAALADRILLDLDLFAAARARTELEHYLITEDCAIDDATDRFHRLWLHGPASAALLARVADTPAIAEIRHGQVVEAAVAGAPVVIDRHDTAGTIGLGLLVPAEHAVAVYQALSTAWSARRFPGDIAPPTDLARRIGWHALNIARIEAGTPLYMLDFGPDSLPHECGRAVLRDRVSFTKGCYLGQEIVARMQSLGHPRQVLVGLRIEPAPGAEAATGLPVVEADRPGGGAVIGAVTSAAFSPLNGGAPVCFAMVKHAHAGDGARVFIQADGARLAATVQTDLAFAAPTVAH